MKQRFDESGNVFIANYESGRCWFLDRHRQLVHKMPVEFRRPSHFRAIKFEKLINPVVPISSYNEAQITLHKTHFSVFA